jgi:hypothetical protein
VFTPAVWTQVIFSPEDMPTESKLNVPGTDGGVNGATFFQRKVHNASSLRRILIGSCSDNHGVDNFVTRIGKQDSEFGELTLRRSHE